jgi:spermidine/putrescine transport system permease protein
MLICVGGPLYTVFRMSFNASPGALKADGWSFLNYPDVIETYYGNIWNSLIIGGTATVISFAVAMPLAYFISFYGGRFRAILVFAAVAPFLTSYLVRVIMLQTLLGANGPVFGTIASVTGVQLVLLGTPLAVLLGLAYQLFPFILLPMYAAFERVDRNLCAASEDLFAKRCGPRGMAWGASLALLFGLLFTYVVSGKNLELSLAHVSLVVVITFAGALAGYMITETFSYVILPLSLSGVFAAALLSFVPALGDYVNAGILGNIGTTMAGNVIQTKFLIELDYAGAAALASLLLAFSVALLLVFFRVVKASEALDVI